MFKIESTGAGAVIGPIQPGAAVWGLASASGRLYGFLSSGVLVEIRQELKKARA